MGIVYRPPDQPGFINKLSSAIENAKRFDSHESIILGDFNLDLNYKNSNTLKRYKEFCTMLGLKQLID